MSKHSSPALTMRDALYEAPGPKMHAKIRIGTAISLVAVAALERVAHDQPLYRRHAHYRARQSGAT